jgi:hypothetical protein|tara:strand:- start:17 stop:667 length:651 start_codon:yes stop_codon:yes gene_type:complete
MKVDLIVPNSLKEITLKQYQKFIKIQKENDDPYFLQCKMIEIFCNLDSNAVRNLKLSDADKIVNVLNLMFEEKPKLINTFKLGKIEYGFIPKLEDISLGEYVDLDTYMGDWDNMHIAMNVLYRPITEKIKDKYLIEDYNTESKDKLDEIPLDVVLGSVFFLYNLGMELSTVMLNYLEEEEVNNLMQQQTFQKNGDGIKVSLDSLKEILQDLKISLN